MNQRSFIVAPGDASLPLSECLMRQLRLPRTRVLDLVRLGQVRIRDEPCTDPRRRTQAGERIIVVLDSLAHSRAVHKQDRDHSVPAPIVLFADQHIVVVNKPAGLTTMRHGEEKREFGARAQRFLPPTLQDLLRTLLGGGGDPKSRARAASAIRAVHRLDKETSGIVVFARNVKAERDLGQQFRAHSTDRLYRALVRGRAIDQRIESWLVPDRGDGRRGSALKPGSGQRAVTHVRVLEAWDGHSLVECRLETGRTHQVRIHLGEVGTPLCGERIYDRPLHGQPLPDQSGAGRVMLHALSLGFDHPATGKRVEFKTSLPKDMSTLLHRLRKG